MDAAERARGEAFRAFVVASWPALVRTGILLTGDQATAEDLVQTALPRSYRAFRGTVEPQSWEAYTRTVMTRLATRWRRTGWRTERVSVIPDRAAAHHDPGPALLVRRALMALPVDQRAVVVLRYFDGLSESEIAAALGIAPGTVKSRASRALAALRVSGLLTDDETEERARAQS